MASIRHWVKNGTLSITSVITLVGRTGSLCVTALATSCRAGSDVKKVLFLQFLLDSPVICSHVMLIGIFKIHVQMV